MTKPYPGIPAGILDEDLEAYMSKKGPFDAAAKCDKSTWQKWLDWYGKKHSVLPYGFSDILQALPDGEGEKR